MNEDAVLGSVQEQSATVIPLKPENQNEAAGRMEDLRAVRAEYLHSGVAPGQVRPVVLRSWERCRTAGLNPEVLAAQTPDSHRLARARSGNRDLVDKAEPLMTLVHQTLGEHPHILALSDAEGCILRLLADQKTENDSAARAANLFEGASWHERDIGCNGIGTCLAEGLPLVLIGPEHFQSSYLNWTCIGIPLKGPNGNIVGALDLSMPNENVRTETWGWVLSLASEIEANVSGAQPRLSEPPSGLHTTLHSLTGIVELLISQLNLPPTHARFIDEVRRALATAVTKYTQTERALQESEERTRQEFFELEGIYRNAPLGLCVFDRELRYRRVNERLAEINGVPADAHLGRTVSEIVPSLEQQAAHALREVLETGRSRKFEFRGQTPSSPGVDRIWDEHWYPLRSADGEITGVGVVALEVTESRRAEKALREAVERYERQVRLFEGITSTTPDFVYLFDLQGRFLYANRRLLEVWGMELPEVIGRTCLELGYEQWHHDLHMREIAQVIETKRSIKGEVPFRAPRTGAFGVYEYIFTPVINPDGEVELVAGTTRDVSERKEAEKALRQAKEQLLQHSQSLEKIVEERTAKLRETVTDLEQFTYSLAHDLRTPLRTIRCFSELLLGEPRDNLQGSARDQLMRIASAAERMDQLVCDVLGYARAARAELTPVEVPLDQLVSDIIEQYPHLQRQAADIGIARPLLPVLGNVALVTQCVSNLLANAVKFVAPGVRPKLKVWTEARDAQVRFLVCDNGIGIAPDQHEKIWRIFERCHHPKEYPGTGIGLSIVRKSIERLGGTVGLISEPGKGSTFWFELPLPLRMRPLTTSRT